MTEKAKKQMLFVVNPKSGKVQIRNRLLDIVDLFVGAGYDVQIYTTQCAGDATKAVIQQGATKDLIVCSGGDGTLNETISGIIQLPKHPQLGYIPAGSTNDFATSLGIPKRILSAAKAVVEGKPFAVDVGRFGENRYFAYVAGFGAFTEVSYLTAQDRKNVLGHQAYILEGVKSLAAIRSYEMKVTWEDQVLQGEFIFGMVTNTISIGGFKGLVNKNVALNDGEFEVLMIRMPKTPIELTEIVTCLLLNDEQETDLVYKFKTKSLTFEAQEPIDWVVDGEYGGKHQQFQVENLCQQIEIRIM